ncbi:MAG: DMT family transporter [Acidimicrobiales bacterium]
MNRTGVIRCLVAAALFGASAPAASALAGEVSSLVLAGLLYLGAGLAVAPQVVQSPPSRAALRREWRPAAVAVVAGGAVGPALLVSGLARTSAATASILLNLELAATVALAATIFREHLGWRVVTGAGLVTAAGVLLVAEPGAGISLGAALVAAACVAWGIDNGVTATIDQLRPEHIVLLKGLVAGGANVALGLSLGGRSGIDAATVAAALLVGAVGYGVSIVLWVKGARDLGAARGQIIFATAPFIGASIAWTVLDETVTAVQLVAVVLAAAGVALSIESAHGHAHRHEPIEHDHEHTHDDGHHEHHDGHPVARRHAHPHRHEPRVHVHPHVPDLHHRHLHDAMPEDWFDVSDPN